MRERRRERRDERDAIQGGFISRRAWQAEKKWGEVLALAEAESIPKVEAEARTIIGASEARAQTHLGVSGALCHTAHPASALSNHTHAHTPRISKAGSICTRGG